MSIEQPKIYDDGDLQVLEIGGKTWRSWRPIRHSCSSQKPIELNPNYIDGTLKNHLNVYCFHCFEVYEIEYMVSRSMHVLYNARTGQYHEFGENDAIEMRESGPNSQTAFAYSIFRNKIPSTMSVFASRGNIYYNVFSIGKELGVGSRKYIVITFFPNEKNDISPWENAAKKLESGANTTPWSQQKVRTDIKLLRETQNILDLNTGKLILPSPFNVKGVFDKYFVVERSGMLNLFNPDDGFASPVWFSDITAFNRNDKIITYSVSYIHSIVLRRGEKTIVARPGKPFSLDSVKSPFEEVY